MSKAQIECGELQAAVQASDKVKFRGPVKLIGRLCGTLEFIAHPRANTEKEGSPDYEVQYRPSGSDHMFSVGSAWLKNSDRVDGGDFLSMTLINPDWPDDLSLAAYPLKGKPGTFRVVWSRPRQQQQAA